ncbi:ribosome small subunit-dependent GTPase A [Iodobacter fluviatilis]|uniref:Small ribosomal subunit biogenesis GTPase RsgA n=1 Tax=Iodobacter fluviatilis TaxID=537 RepID=A0A377Q263_9NEIS|nr:ribosome small subunit-dependent GTPase A [Iodobacter fluviatilis]TCU90329.1 ribosome biogenesis GTPase [Iodobacter fluviatilis]STQ89356.1 Putative ribosome biogenesis GTPase RsgA [Iodobacter fluviatilis]
MYPSIEKLRAIGFDQHALQAFHLIQSEPSSSQLELARISNIQRDRFILHDGASEQPAQLRPALYHALQSRAETLAVGDWVLFSQQDHAWIESILPAKNRLSRRNAEGQKQALVANIDLALLVMGLDHDFNLRRLDRYLTLCIANDVLPLLVLSKADCSPQAAEKIAQARAHLPAHIGLLALDGRGDLARESLLPWLAAGQTVVLLGSSGAGKSTLTNTLISAQVQDTGAVRIDDSRGRHTTTSRSLHLCPNGACIIDTPGLRTISLDSDEAGIHAAFSDIKAQAALCRFRDCQHQDEPGCAVRGQISSDRLKSFHKLLREQSRESQTPLQKQAQLAKWKIISKSARNKRKSHMD